MRRKKQTWVEEHEDIVRRAKTISPGPKWKYGFLQVIPDDKELETSLRNNSLFDFLVPEEYLSLKLFFDNLRNYAICAAFVALGVWVWSHGWQLLPPPISGWAPPIVAAMIWVFAGGLALANALQTWILIRELFSAVRAIRVAEFHVYRGGSTLRVLMGCWHIAFSALLDFVVWIAALLVGLTIVCIVIGFTAYLVLIRSGAS